VIQVERLVKRYGRVAAVDGVSFRVASGEVVALLGPNGAGKSTTIRAMTGLLRPTAGSVAICGHDMATDGVAAKRRFGFVPDRPYLYPKLSGRELLRFLGRLRQVPGAEARARELLARFELTNAADALVETYSHGMRQRLTFCAALLHSPDVLIVDEPMVGLDPRGARDVRLLMRRHADDGGAVLLTTHSLEVAESVADWVLLMAGGKERARGTLAELRERVGDEGANLEAIFMELTQAAAEDPAAAESSTREQVAGPAA
jgi:ABC-2 type transport system ATP-binding protein